MTSIAAELLATGLVYEAEEQDAGARGGRRARLLVLDSERVVSGGISITDSEARWVVVSLSGARLASGRISRMGHREPDEWIALAMAESNEAMHVWLAGSEKVPLVAGVGVGLPGIVDGAVLRESVILETAGTDLASAWGAVPAPVSGHCFFDNDANCGAWSVAFTGNGEETVVFAHALFHHGADGFRPTVAGLGLSLVLRGSLHYGATNTAGEIRGYHWTADGADQLGVRAGDDPGATTESVLSEVVANLGVVASVIDPDRVVLGGDLTAHAERIRELTSPEGASGPASLLSRSGMLEIPDHEEHSVEIGAARMILHRLFSIPTLETPGESSLGWLSLLERLRDAVQRGGARRTLPA
jgi:predicted NBD/HSP70 family sugar kinase